MDVREKGALPSSAAAACFDLCFECSCCVRIACPDVPANKGSTCSGRGGGGGGISSSDGGSGAREPRTWGSPADAACFRFCLLRCSWICPSAGCGGGCCLVSFIRTLCEDPTTAGNLPGLSELEDLRAVDDAGALPMRPRSPLASTLACLERPLPLASPERGRSSRKYQPSGATHEVVLSFKFTQYGSPD